MLAPEASGAVANTQMLYERWMETARGRARELALVEPDGGRRWTFGQLMAEGERGHRPAQPVLFPRGASSGFVLEVLRAWRHDLPCCPLEEGAAEPPLTRLPAAAQIKFTSATTGGPRLILFSGDQLAADAANIVATMGLRPDWPNLGAISLAHSYGFSNLILPLLLHGIPLILTGAPLPAAVEEAARGHEAITLPAVPALWRVWHETSSLPPNTRLALSAGAPLPIPLEQAVFAARGLKIHNFYGSSECGGIAYDQSLTPRSDATCVGAPMNGVALAITGAQTLEVRGGAVGSGYWPECDERLGAGRFETSDLAELRDGLVYLRGRAGDLINVAGRKISPDTVEQALLRHERVRECLVFGVPEQAADRSEAVVACVAFRGAADVAGLRQFLLAILPAWQVPREWVVLQELPANARGKVSRASWRERYLAGKLG